MPERDLSSDVARVCASCLPPVCLFNGAFFLHPQGLAGEWWLDDLPDSHGETSPGGRSFGFPLFLNPLRGVPPK